ncbi:hypothetical protein A9Q84_19795 [Halobacteriovorax marinus]|uniref:PilZ domain-containing protein n=1 Tax=Halobacteriovorax marinus TaxID=97084 RepID=A0A1Y5F8I3_9BACT|nr:hypothetical protein A9Q84_19795 [Halobacteriovorax marinus]
MVESSKEKFTGLNVSEISSKISSFVNSEKPIRVWSKGSEPSLAFIRNIEKRVITLDVSTSIIEVDFSDKVFLNFSFNSVDYFAKGSLLSENNGLLSIELEEEVFKSEKRHNERLLTFPHHQVHAYFKVYSDENSSNIISINRFKETPNSALESFVSEKMKQIVDEEDAIAELMGFRILDLSSDGLSFFANSRETSYFAGLKDDGGIQFTLMFEGTSYSLKYAEIVYIVDYVNQRAARIPMKKIGIHFDENDEIKESINKLINDSGALREVDKSFESFLAD